MITADLLEMSTDELIQYRKASYLQMKKYQYADDAYFEDAERDVIEYIDTILKDRGIDNINELEI